MSEIEDGCMQTCPNCGSESRIGANFCTSCGYRFVENGGLDSQADATHPNESAPAWGATQLAADASVHREGWPAAAASAEAEESGWDPSPANAPAAEPDPSPVSESETVAAEFWPEAASDTWPSATTAPILGSGGGDAAAEQPRESQAVQDDEPGGGQQDAQTHALNLLDQLRAAIVATGPAGSADLAGVIADLEVAATPPGAFPPDDLAELRDALFAARENPRDVDTIVDLTKRIDALVSLVIAYDRAIAAIERSLETLREEGDG